MKELEEILNRAETEERDKIWKILHEKYPIEKELLFDETTVLDKIKEQPYRKLQYDELFLKEKARYDAMFTAFEKVQGERFDYYRFGIDKELSKNEIEKYYLPKDEILINLRRKLRQQNWISEYFRMCSEAWGNLGWRMKEFLNAVKNGY